MLAAVGIIILPELRLRATLHSAAVCSISAVASVLIGGAPEARYVECRRGCALPHVAHDQRSQLPRPLCAGLINEVARMIISNGMILCPYPGWKGGSRHTEKTVSTAAKPAQARKGE